MSGGKQHVVGVFINLSKAFNILDHSILLYQLAYTGVRGLPLKILQNYLSNRKQCVYCNEKYSSVK